ncbi:hypothetical protein J6590_072493 [Homalodisca vitripennis]|nr:hypothetical protein J6590_072493 [Homalodisca vitripennis]
METISIDRRTGYSNFLATLYKSLATRWVTFEGIHLLNEKFSITVNEKPKGIGTRMALLQPKNYTKGPQPDRVMFRTNPTVNCRFGRRGKLNISIQVDRQNRCVPPIRNGGYILR